MAAAQLVLLDALTLGDVDYRSAFEPYGELIDYSNTDPSETAERIAGAHAVLTNKVKITQEVLATAPDLKLICALATGTDHIDKTATEARGIPVRNAVGYSTASVAQHTLAMALSLWQSLPAYHHQVQSKAYSNGLLFTNTDPSVRDTEGSIWGIIGMGEIGQRVAQMAGATGFQIAYTSTSGNNLSQPYPHYSLKKLLTSCDVVSIHAPLTEATKGLLGEAQLGLMKPGGILINVGRGGIVDEAALAKVVAAGKIKAGFDVFAQEPLSASSPLLSIDDASRLLLTPHMAWGSFEARSRLVAQTAAHLKAFFPEGVVT